MIADVVSIMPAVALHVEELHRVYLDLVTQQVDVAPWLDRNTWVYDAAPHLDWSAHLAPRVGHSTTRVLKFGGVFRPATTLAPLTYGRES